MKIDVHNTKERGKNVKKRKFESYSEAAASALGCKVETFDMLSKIGSLTSDEFKELHSNAPWLFAEFYEFEYGVTWSLCPSVEPYIRGDEEVAYLKDGMPCFESSDLCTADLKLGGVDDAIDVCLSAHVTWDVSKADDWKLKAFDLQGIEVTRMDDTYGKDVDSVRIGFNADAAIDLHVNETYTIDDIRPAIGDALDFQYHC